MPRPEDGKWSASSSTTAFPQLRTGRRIAMAGRRSLAANDFDAVVIWKVDRLARRHVLDFLHADETLQQLGTPRRRRGPDRYDKPAGACLRRHARRVRRDGIRGNWGSRCARRSSPAAWCRTLGRWWRALQGTDQQPIRTDPAGCSSKSRSRHHVARRGRRNGPERGNRQRHRNVAHHCARPTSIGLPSAADLGQRGMESPDCGRPLTKPNPCGYDPSQSWACQEQPARTPRRSFERAVGQPFVNSRPGSHLDRRSSPHYSTSSIRAAHRKPESEVRGRRRARSFSRVVRLHNCLVYLCRGTNQKRRAILYCPSCRQTIGRAALDPYLVQCLLNDRGPEPLGRSTVRDQWAAAGRDDLTRREVLLSQLESLSVRRGVVGRAFDEQHVQIRWLPATATEEAWAPAAETHEGEGLRAD